jgi:hypothetical protein
MKRERTFREFLRKEKARGERRELRKINHWHIRFVWNYCVNPRTMGSIYESYKDAYKGKYLDGSQRTLTRGSLIVSAVRTYLNPTIQGMIKDQMAEIFKANGVEYGSIVRRQSELIDKLSTTMDAVLQKVKDGAADKELVGTITSLARETRESLELMADWAGFSPEKRGSSSMPFYEDATYVDMPRARVKALGDGSGSDEKQNAE